MNGSEDTPVDRGPRRGAALAALAAAAALWGWAAASRSLWGDEFHTLHHVRAEGALGLLEVLRTDNHPPLSFLLVKGSRALLGEGELALRLPSLLCALAALLATARLARFLPDRDARRLAPWLVATSSYFLVIASEARMYALLALCSIGLLDAVLRVLLERRSAARALPWVVAGLHAHYYFVHVLAVLGLAVLIRALRRPDERRAIGRLVAWTVLGCAAFLPWALWGLAAQLAHGLPSGGRYESLSHLAQSIAHFFFLETGGLDHTTRVALVVPGVAAAALLGLLGCARLGTDRSNPGSRTALALLVAAGLVVPVWCLGVSHLFERSSFNWRYLAGSASPVFLLTAAGVAGRGAPLRRVIAGVVLATTGAASLLIAAGPAREDYRGATAYLLEHASPEDVLVVKAVWDGDPAASPDGYDYYRARLAPADEHAGPVVVRAEDPTWRRALEAERTWVMMRSRFSEEVRLALAARFGPPRVHEIGQVMRVLEYGPRPAGR
jgi:hypothetical protein